MPDDGTTGNLHTPDCQAQSQSGRSQEEPERAAQGFHQWPDAMSNLESGPLALIGTLLGACQAGPSTGAAGPDTSEFSCSIPTRQIFDSGTGKDGIPALTDPVMAAAGTTGAAYLDPEDRVIGIVLEGQALAIPHRVLWRHEIVNLNIGSARVAITYCPLTGSSMAFDRSGIEGAELGVSGLLFQNNLIMYDRRTQESLWPQMLRGARCGSASGVQLQMLPVAEMTWGGWTELHPDSQLPANDANSSGRPFATYQYPYGSYEQLDNARTLFPMSSIDARRPPKERVLGIPGRSTTGGGIAFPYGELDMSGGLSAAHGSVDGRGVVVLWDGAKQGATAFYADVDGLELEFEIHNETFVDRQTTSSWTIEGSSVGGALAGERLEPIAEAYVAFWVAWAAFHPQTQLWEARQ